VVQVAVAQVDIIMIMMTETLDTPQALMVLQILAAAVGLVACLQQSQKQAVLELLLFAI
jgi:hypothetical protein